MNELKRYRWIIDQVSNKRRAQLVEIFQGAREDMQDEEGEASAAHALDCLTTEEIRQLDAWEATASERPTSGVSAE